MRWSAEEEEIIETFARLGVDRIRREIHKECGRVRSVNSIKVKASRMGVSLKPYEVCPRCARRVSKLVPKTGLCKVCHTKELRDKERQFNEYLWSKAREIDEEKEREKYSREYATLRKRNSRLAQQYGLQMRRK